MKGLFQKWGLLSVVFVFMLAFLTACGTDKESTGAAGDVTGEGASEGIEEVAGAFPVTFTDDAGREVTIESEPQSICRFRQANGNFICTGCGRPHDRCF